MAAVGALTTGGVVRRFGPVILGLFCVQLDFFSLGLALPTIAKDLGTTTTDLQWVVSGYMLAIGALMIPMSRLADTVGRKRVLLSGVAVFGLSSLVCGAVSSPELLIAARVVQGIGGAIILPVSFAMVSNRTTDAERPKTLGTVLGYAQVGTALGPIIGGGFAATIGWRWVFLVNVPVALVAFVWGLRSLAESTDRGTRSVRQIDWLGVALVSLGVAAISLSVDLASTSGAVAAGALVVGLVLVLILVRHEGRHPWPLVSPALLRLGGFMRVLGAGSLANAGYCVMIIIVTIQLQQVRGLSALDAGLIFFVPAVATAVCGPVSGWLAPRFDNSLVMALCIVLGGAGLIVQSVAEPLWLDAIGLACAGFALGMGYSFTSVATQSLVPVSRAGEASGFVLTVIVTIGAFGVVIAATGLELFGGTDDLASACSSMLFWTGVACVVLGAAFGAVQLRGRRRVAVVPRT